MHLPLFMEGHQRLTRLLVPDISFFFLARLPVEQAMTAIILLFGCMERC